jgi:hypothetical protein
MCRRSGLPVTSSAPCQQTRCWTRTLGTACLWARAGMRSLRWYAHQAKLDMCYCRGAMPGEVSAPSPAPALQTKADHPPEPLPAQRSAAKATPYPLRRTTISRQGLRRFGVDAYVTITIPQLVPAVNNHSPKPALALGMCHVRSAGYSMTCSWLSGSVWRDHSQVTCAVVAPCASGLGGAPYSAAGPGS